MTENSDKCRLCGQSTWDKQVVCEKHVAGPLKGGLGVNLGSDEAEHLAADAAVNHPKHYNFGDIEVIDAIEDWDLDFHEANAVKYIARAKYKGNELQDLKKARWYIERKIKKLGED